MAARRLILVLVVLLGISIAAAAIAPDRQTSLLGDGGEETAEETTTETTTTDSTEEEPERAIATSDAVVKRTITADAEDPETVRAEPGDQLELLVRTDRFRQLEIEALGLIEDATPDAPAAFNILLRESGAVAITDPASGKIVGRIVAAPERV